MWRRESGEGPQVSRAEPPLRGAVFRFRSNMHAALLTTINIHVLFIRAFRHYRYTYRRIHVRWWTNHIHAARSLHYIRTLRGEQDYVGVITP